MLFPCALWPPCDAFFWRRGCGRLGQPKELPTVAILSGWIEADLAPTSGIHRAVDVIKMLMAGADVTMLCSILLRRGIDQIRVIEREMEEWMEAHEYDSGEELKGSMNQKNCPDPAAFERAQYLRGLSSSWRTMPDL